MNLIELMVVIIVLAILSLIAMLTIKNLKSQSEHAATMTDLVTVQTAVDRYHFLGTSRSADSYYTGRGTSQSYGYSVLLKTDKDLNLTSN